MIRGRGGEDQRAINIPWVRNDRRYHLTARFQEKELGTLTGQQLQAGHLRISLPPFSQEILELSPE